MDGGPGVLVDEHLSARCDERGWPSVADVIVCRAGCPHRTEPGSPDGPLADRPGALVAAKGGPGGACVVGTRQGGQVRLSGLEPWMAASLAHAWLVWGGRLPDLGIRAVIVWAASRGPTPGDGREPLPPVARPAG
jgi:hypothetical protein